MLTIVLFAWCGTTRSTASRSLPVPSGPGSSESSPIICFRYLWASDFTSGPKTVMLLSNSGFGQMIEFTSLTGPLAYVCRTSTSVCVPRGAGPTTSAAAPSPKIMREVRTVPILSENFSAQTSSTGLSTSWSRRTASESP